MHNKKSPEDEAIIEELLREFDSGIDLNLLMQAKNNP